MSGPTIFSFVCCFTISQKFNYALLAPSPTIHGVYVMLQQQHAWLLALYKSKRF